MNKVLHVLVYVFLALAAAALYFELQLNARRTLLTDRNRLQEDYLVKIARTIEKGDPARDTSLEIRKDASPVEARLVDSPDMNNVLEDYNGALEQTRTGDDVTYKWGENERRQLRAVYATDVNGETQMDGNQPLMRGPGTEDELLSKLFESAKAQQARLNTTRAALADLRAKLEAQVQELNQLKPIARQDKVTIAELKAKIAEAEQGREKTRGEVAKAKSQVEELNGEIASKNDEIQRKDEEIEAKNDELAKAKQLNENLRKMLQSSIQTSGGTAAADVGTAVASLPSGDKGQVIEVDNEKMFAIVEFSPDAMKELKGPDLSKPLPVLDLGIKRVTSQNPAGAFIGRVRLRQEVKGKPYVICDILGAWEQEKIEDGDVIFAD